MAEPLKNIYDKNYIDRLAADLKRFAPNFKETQFKKDVFAAPWKELELKDRMRRIRESVAGCLPLSYEESLKVLVEAGEGFGSFAGMLFPDFVSSYGLNAWAPSMRALKALTAYSSSEFAIRPFLRAEPKKGMEQMLKWSLDKNEHVRRLASEGCRPRLPWAEALVFLKKDPTAILPILENLKKDKSLYVRKSVANNLNDISKDHPNVVLKIAKKWLKSGHEDTQWIVKHALRTLLKSGNKEAMSLFGYGEKKDIGDISITLETPLIYLDDRLRVSIKGNLRKKMKLRIEYALHFLLKNGSWGRKVFKISEKEMLKGDFSIVREHHFKTMTTRSFNEGAHAFELILNGISFGIKPFYFWNERSAYQVYMLKTERNTLYTGVTTDVNRRFLEHLGLEKGGAKFTKAQKPERLLYLEKATNRSHAQKREAAIKKLSRKQKEQLVDHSFGS
jgi:3-methyladenine DNA glycosylase AlkC/predicted GIY-YIG superfamily endonuclease